MLEVVGLAEEYDGLAELVGRAEEYGLPGAEGLAELEGL